MNHVMSVIKFESFTSCASNLPCAMEIACLDMLHGHYFSIFDKIVKQFNKTLEIIQHDTFT